MKKKQRDKTKKYTLIGGQALLEGVMMRGKSSMAMAVRSESGEILLETERLKPKKKVLKLPIIRGIFAFFGSMITGVTAITRSAEASGDEDEQIGKLGMGIAVFLGLAIALVFFFFIPGLLAGLFNDLVFDNVLVKNLVSGTIRIAIFIGYLFAVSLLKDIRRTFMYHGAEHRTINCFESGMPLTVENVQKCSTRHNRCGTTFMFLVMLISILVFAFVDFGISQLITMDKGVVRTLTFMAIKFLFLPLVAGISYEILFLFAKMPDNMFSMVLRAPGLALQRLTTKIPDDQMAEVAIVSFNAVLLMETDKSVKTQKFDCIPVETAKNAIRKVLVEVGAEDAEEDWLLCAVTGKKRGELPSVVTLTLAQFNRLQKLLSQRKQMPLDYCLSESCFFGHNIYVDKRVLIPRSETEILTEVAIKVIGEKEELAAKANSKNKNDSDEGNESENMVSALDLCSGSGCIALCLSKATAARVVAADVSADALAVATKNLRGTNVELVQSDLFENLSGRKFDVIVSNPPYIKSGDIEGLSNEVKAQPHIALDGGEDGLNIYRRIIAAAPEYIKDNGYLLFEVGITQADEVAKMLADAGFSTEVIKDLEGVDRVIKAQKTR